VMPCFPTSLASTLVKLGALNRSVHRV
jgi:hypothetical protein